MHNYWMLTAASATQLSGCIFQKFKKKIVYSGLGGLFFFPYSGWGGFFSPILIVIKYLMGKLALLSSY